MAFVQKSLRIAAAAAAAIAATAAPVIASAGVGYVAYPDLAGTWSATLSGFTGCGQSAMLVAINLNAAGTGTATLTTHGQCGDSVAPGQTFKVLTLNTNGTGTANLTCGAGCGWNLRLQVSPDRQIMNLIDIDPVNPGNYIAGVAVHY
ncbi:MAG: hypothetical protein ABJD97_05990 [Betaproteobacteria bacterium]